ncbi:DUF3300 domain-containing protein [Methyloceanibacter sp. wino2]|uniref:DUF3300 domain-containing protein n=1 Tax=Methyloceanibacter sp. wino2 TaxID=2170729 RepID=UPI000D3EAE3A|nr:DUF3300 domain-containing protein [Methyloceanibacter sp. wino2]
MGEKMRFLVVSTAFTSALWVYGTALAQDSDSVVEAVSPPPQTEAPADAGTAVAQDSDSVVEAVSPPPEAEASDDAGAAPSNGAQDTQLSQAELEQLVAPIALYPDPLLANVLIASTYPLEIVQAERWYQKNKDLKGDALQKAVAGQDWDDSIKDLVSVPDALEMLNKDLDWTQKLGDAVLAQQSDVMNAVQALRARAKENGTLESNPQQTVTVTQTVVQNNTGSSSGGAASTQAAAPQEVIAIQPTNPEKIYVPYYEPSVAYGAWPYPSYQPYYFPPPPGYAFGSALATGLVWSAGFAIGNAIWGNDINWGRNDINVNVNRNISGNTINRNNVNVQKWEHNSEHRRGVQYNNTDVRNKFANSGNRNNIGDNAGNRRPGGADGRPGPGNRPGNGGGRPTVGDLESDLKKPGGGSARPGGGNGRPGNLAGDKRPGGAGGGRPSVGDIEAGLKKPGGGGGNRPGAGGGDRPKVGGGGGPKPGAGNRPGGGGAQANLRDRPASKPAARKPQSRPSGNAFEKRDGAGARQAAARGRASAGGRHVSRGGGGGRRAGGGGRRR